MSERQTEYQAGAVPDASVIVETLLDEGAVLLRGYVDDEEQHAICEEVLAHELAEHDKSDQPIPEQFHAAEWDQSAAPPLTRALGARITGLLDPALPDWRINHVRAQLYAPGEAGIEWHRDYTRDLRVIAVASFLGASLFQARLTSGEKSWQLQPGDLTLLRGTLLSGNLDDRPYHRVSPPEKGRRLSLAYREVASEKPILEPQHV